MGKHAMKRMAEDEEPDSPEKPRTGQPPAKRAATAAAEGGAKPFNPFAGVSLFSTPPGISPLSVASGGASGGASSGGASSGGGNPFAGISLFGHLAAGASSGGAASSGGSLFAGSPFAAAAAAAGPGSFGSFGSSSSSASTGTSAASGSSSSTSGGVSGFAAAAAAAAGTYGFGASGGSFGSAGAPAGDSANGNAGNPFMGLSLFSSTPAPANGSLFAAAVEGIQAAASTSAANAGTASAGGAAAPAAAIAAKAAEGDADDPEAANDEEEDEDPAAVLTGETGEEEEEVVFRGECKLWKLVSEEATPAAGDADAKKASAEESKAAEEGAKTWKWQEKGWGIVHINRHSKTKAGRLVMRMRGVGKLLLNTPVFPTSKYEKVGQKSVKFVGVDVDREAGDGEGGEQGSKEVALCAYRLSLQGSEKQGEFLTVLRDSLNVQLTA